MGQLSLVFPGGYNWGMTNSLSPLPTVGNSRKWKTFLQEKATGLKWTGWILLPRKLLSGRRWQILPTLGLKQRCPSGCFWLPRFPNDPTQPIPPSKIRSQVDLTLSFLTLWPNLLTPCHWRLLGKQHPQVWVCMHFFGCMANSDRRYAQRDVRSSTQECSGTS